MKLGAWKQLPKLLTAAVEQARNQENISSKGKKGGMNFFKKLVRAHYL